MNPTVPFVMDVGLVASLSVSLTTYVRGPVKNLLVELCGTVERSSFWLAFSNVTLVLVPLIIALDYRPEFGPDRNFVSEMATQPEASHHRLRHGTELPCDHPDSIPTARQVPHGSRFVTMKEEISNR